MPSFEHWRLEPAALRRGCDPESLPFETTETLREDVYELGQERAIEAIGLGIAMRQRSHNLFAMGPEGLGRRSLIERLLRAAATTRAAPDDWCHVFNFATPHQPALLRLPSGAAPKLRGDMARLVEDLRAGIPAAFESDAYRTQRQALESELNARQEQAIGAVGDRARARNIALLRTPGGFGFAPLEGESVMTPENFQRLPPEAQRPIEEAIAQLQHELEAVVADMPKWRREAQRRLRELNREHTQRVVASLIEDMKTTYATLEPVLAHLEAMQNDVLDHAELFQMPREAEGGPTPVLVTARGEPVGTLMDRYAVNVLVTNAAEDGAPVVFEDHPTHDNLLGRIEHESRMGMMVTDFTLIRAGALHRANGGFLVLDALKLLQQPLAWDALKRALRAGEIRIESFAQALGLISTVSLTPQPVPLDLKVVLVGDRRIGHLLQQFDPEFAELFKVMADFEEDMARDAQADARYAQLIATVGRRHGLRALTRAAVAVLIEQAARSASRADRLSLEMSRLADLMLEADQLAGAAGLTLTGCDQVRQAIEAQRRRASRVSDRLREATLSGRLLIDTAGERIGQVNALSVIRSGGLDFGVPARITASVRLGSSGVLDIEREVRLSGPVHAKGVLILGGLLAARYCPEQPLSLAARLVFEQTYGGVEGDSASVAEWCALLSAIARVPLRQSIAITGSINQHGDVQAVGGVNEKIEGFFSLCRERGLDGSHAVVIPRANADDLMLDEAVVGAAREGRFQIHAVAQVDEAMMLLTGLPAGARDAGGRFARASLNARVEARLLQLAQRSRQAPGTSDSRTAKRRA